MITLVVAEPGMGKTSLLCKFCKEIYKTQGRRLLKQCQEVITEINKKRKNKFELPDEPPIYASFDVKFRIGYEKFFEPFKVNPYYMGLKNKKLPTLYFLPYGRVFIPEFQKYSNSRQGQTLLPAFSRTFEIMRHNHLEFFLDGHRGSFIDLKVRALTRRIIEIQKQEHEKDSRGRIIKTIWHCKEFTSLRDYDDYVERHGENYTETTYEYNGNIFKLYDSFNCMEEFIPPEGERYNTLKPLTAEEVKKLPPEIARYYSSEEPDGFRSKKAG